MNAFKNKYTYCVYLGIYICAFATDIAQAEEFELTPQDGWFNNLIHPDWGAIDGHLLRKSKVAYSDGVYMPSGQDRPNPFKISLAGHHGPPGLGSLRNRNAFMVYFGQQVVEEILDAQRPGCPREFFNIPVKPDIKNPNFDPEGKGNIELPVFRSRFDQRTGLSPNNPRQQLNEITPFIDGSLMYGVGKAWTDAIRELSEEFPGRLKAQDLNTPISQSFPADNDIRLPFANPPPPREHELKPVARFWRLGNPRGNENPFLLAFGVLWFRYHNYVADSVHKQHPELNDEQVFNIARKKVIAVHQKIVMYDWLPAWLHIDNHGKLFDMPSYDKSSENNPFEGYDPNIHPGITQEFQTAALRFGHTLVTPGTWIRDKQCNFNVLPIKTPGGSGNAHAVRLCNAYWNPQEFLNSSPDAFDNMLMGLATTRAEREDHIVVPDLREHLFGPLEFSRRDLVAINIQRARDHGLPDYNSVREAYGLARKKSWEDINNYTVSVHDFASTSDALVHNYTNGLYMGEPIERVKTLYGNTSAPDTLDLFSGGLLETTPDGPGELFKKIMLEQFLRIRHGDRFWFENRDNQLFDDEQIDEIWNTTILDVILAVTNINASDINANPFLINGISDPCHQPEQLKADSSDQLNNITTLEQCTPLQHYDYFSGSEASFALSFAALGLCIPGMIHAGIGHSHVSAFLSSLGIPSIHHTGMKRMERTIGNVIEQTARDSCVQASEEERKQVEVRTFSPEVPITNSCDVDQISFEEAMEILENGDDSTDDSLCLLSEDVGSSHSNTTDTNSQFERVESPRSTDSSACCSVETVASSPEPCILNESICTSSTTNETTQCARVGSTHDSDTPVEITVSQDAAWSKRGRAMNSLSGTIGVMILMARFKQRKMLDARRRQAPQRQKEDPNTHLAVEWVGFKDDERNIKIRFDKERKKLHVTDRGRKPLRMIDLRFVDKVHFRLSTDKGCTVLSVRVPGDIDLVLRFAFQVNRGEFITSLEQFLTEVGVSRNNHEMKEDMILKDATTKEQRKKVLDQFLRVVCLQAYKTESVDALNFDADAANSVSRIQLTRTEFSEVLGLKPTSLFVRNMFLMVDKDRNGLVSFQEFMEMFTILARGGADDKAKMLFNMHDLRGKGELTPEAFTKMIKSMLDLSDSSLDDSDVATLVSTLYQQVGLRQGQNMTLTAFKEIFASEEYEKTLEQATLQLKGAKSIWQNKPPITETFSIRRKTFIATYGQDSTENDPPTLQRQKSKLKVETKQTAQPMTGWQKSLYSFSKNVENYKRQIFWVTLYILISIGIFVERAYYYSFEREHVGLRRLAGYGVTVTRGAASGMMWTYSCLLITMSRNTITFLRETFLHKFIPFDSFHAMHKFVAVLALVFTVAHCVGHGINLYHISTWPSTDLNCVFREYFRATDKLASFHYWAWTTITGLTGIILTIIVIIMYVFAIPYARRHLFNAFWLTHSLYIFLYIFMILHGSGRLVQAPLTQNFLMGPLVIYVIDKLISFSRKKVRISVHKAELLPSDVLGLTFKRPLNFEYKSGQWVRIACLELGEGEYHPFTLTSAPHEEDLSLHIRAVGPWTMNMRKTYDANSRDGKEFPKVFIDGPFGEGHQDWYRYKVSVLVGGGIGVTPFASILKDIVFKSKTSNVKFPCEKVYFLWVTRTQKQFEWLTDIIREVEENDHKRLVNVHIFITQFQQKFDLRTTMLYICERNFQKVCGKSLFTGLRATTHFGRPEFEQFFKSLHYVHPTVRQVGVFSCGPPPMTLNVDRACSEMNKYDDFPTYSHHFENF